MARSRYQKGSVVLYGNTWYGKYREDIIGPDGVTVRVQRRTRLGTKKEYPTKPLARRRLEQLLCRINAPEYRPGRVATVAEFAERWVTEILSKQKPPSRKSAASHLRAHIIPYLGKLRLDALGIENHQMFVTHLSGKIPSSKTIRNVLVTLSSMLSTAKDWGYICEGLNIGKLALPERSIKKEARSFTLEEGRRILAAATNPWRLMYALAGMAGMRAGEIMGLRAADVDIQRRLIHINQTAWCGQIQTAKTAVSEATLPIPDALHHMLTAYLATWHTNPLGLLFINKLGRAFTAERVVKKHLHPLLDALGIPRPGRCGFHAFRHMHTTMLVEGGASPKTAQRQLRHSDVRTTLQIYAHVVEDSHRRAVEKVSRKLVQVGPKTERGSQLIQ